MYTLRCRVRRGQMGRQMLSWLGMLAMLTFGSSPAGAVVPSGNTVPVIGAAGNFSSAVQIFNNQGAAGTATLFMEKPDPANPNYVDLCFVPADHVMRNVVGGPSLENDTLPYDANDNYGGTPAAVQPAQTAFLQAIDVGGVNDPSGFYLRLATARSSPAKSSSAPASI
jgi:hypothetical protein